MVETAVLSIMTAVAVLKPSPLPVAVSGWTWTASMGALQSLLIAIFGGGGFYGIIRGVAMLQRVGNERSKQDADRELALVNAEVARDTARWTELMDFNDRLQKRVENLETALRDERRRCDEEVADLRKEIAGMYRQTAARTTSAMRLAQPRDDLPQDMKDALKRIDDA